MKNSAIKMALISAALLATQQLSAQYISTIIGNGVPAAAYAGDGGLAINAGLYSPASVAFDGAGNLYVADMNHSVIRKVNTLGIISTIAGNGMAGYSGDDSAATSARLNHPTGVAIDLAGNIFIADNGNNVIRKVSASGVITTYAGTGVVGYSGDLGLAIAARLTAPQGVAIDASGTLYIADAGNNVVRAVSDTGTIYTVAGTGTPGNTGNGGAATAATLHYPTSVAIDVIGNIYIADFYNNVVKKINTDGIISVVAGSGSVGASGDGGPATMASLYYPSAISIDGARNIYIADQGNNAVRKVDSVGTITRFAGTYTSGYLGDGGLAVNALLSSPKSIAADGWGRVYIADYGNNVVRMVSSSAVVNGVTNVATPQMNVYPNPTSGDLHIDVPAIQGVAVATVTDVLGNIVLTRQITQGNTLLSLSNLADGQYLVKVTSANGTYLKKVTVIK